MRTRKRIVQIMQVFSLARFPECFLLLTLLVLLMRYHRQRYFICHSAIDAIDATITLHLASSCSNGTHLRRICHDAATALAF
jgi:tRNA U55 pseudouridine synthase TruB